MKLKQLIIENFKGLKSIKVNFNTEGVTEIIGENGAGKTSIQDALYWLFFDKNSAGKSDFNVRPLESGVVIKGLSVSVTAEVLHNDNTLHLYQKDQEENIVKGKLKGYKNKYWIDEVPKKQSEFIAEFSEIIDENTFKLLTDLYYFNHKMHWTDRRNTLLELAGENIKKPNESEFTELFKEKERI